MRSEDYTQASLRKACPSCDTEADYALYITQKHFEGIQSWRAPIEISRGPEGRYLEDQSPEIQAVEIFLEFLQAINARNLE